MVNGKEEGAVHTIRDSLSRDTSCVLSVPFFVELDSAFAPRRPVHAQHAQVPHVHPQLLHGAAPIYHKNDHDHDEHRILNIET